MPVAHIPSAPYHEARLFKKTRVAHSIPGGWRRATKDEVEADLRVVTGLLEEWDIALLANNYKVSGSGYGGKVEPYHPASKNNSGGDQIITTFEALTATFQPGFIGIEYNVQTGEIGWVEPGGIADKAGVENGMTIFSVEGMNYVAQHGSYTETNDLLSAARENNNAYQVTFGPAIKDEDGPQVPEFCSDYMYATGCWWTNDWSCPGQMPGQQAEAKDDGSTGYRCCCDEELWKAKPLPLGFYEAVVSVVNPISKNNLGQNVAQAVNWARKG